MANPQLATRVVQSVYDTVNKIASDRGVNRSDVVKELIHIGIKNSDQEITIPDGSVYKAGKKLAEQISNYQQEIKRIQKERDHWKQIAENKQSDQRPTLSHPLITEIEEEGIQMANGDNEIVIKSLPALLDFITSLKNDSDE